jgi:BirA family biotin operon repressor/biotin-[acetyl-CoA-carboxylase] ligase
MVYPLVAATVPRLLVLDESPSTNSHLTALAAADELDWFTTVITANQTAGRGRLDRVWVAPPGASVAVSTLVPGTLGGWIPLAAGLAMADALAPLVGDRVQLKWPNDVQVDGDKICGILAESTAHGVVVGAGLNTAMTRAQLPVPTATSLHLVGVDSDADAVVAAFLSALRGHLASTAGDLRERVSARLSTIGRRVRVDLPDGSALSGDAVGIDGEGRLEIVAGTRGRVTVAAGDVVHVRG